MKKTRDEIIIEYNTDFSNPGAEKSGEVLYSSLLTRTKRLLPDNRDIVTEIFRKWLEMRNKVETNMAMRILMEIKMPELLPELVKLREDIIEGKIFTKLHLRLVDRAISNNS